MLVGPAKALFMDEISTGLDSSTTFQITKMLRQIVHLMDSTVVVSLLQPPPETYALFDDVILLADGQIVYQGPCGTVLEFMAFMGFRCPERKATADFLQEVSGDFLVVKLLNNVVLGTSYCQAWCRFVDLTSYIFVWG